MLKKIAKLNVLLGAVLFGAAASAGYYLVKQLVAVEVYRDRLEALASDYEGLRATYNQAIRRTAVTELVVKDRKLSVVVRTAEGVLETIPANFKDFNPDTDEVHVDFVVIDGRLWVRRVMRVKPPNAEQVMINPKLVRIDWDTEGAVYGTTVYRPLSEGRWVVNATSNGALTLVRKPDDEDTQLVPPPPIRQYEEVQKEVDQKVDDISAGDVMRRLFRGGE